MSDFTPESDELPPALALALPAWRLDTDVPDFAPGVVRRLREERRRERPNGGGSPRRWRQAAWATLAAALLIGCSVLWMQGDNAEAPRMAAAEPSVPAAVQPAPSPPAFVQPEREPPSLPPVSVSVAGLPGEESEGLAVGPGAPRLSPERAIALRDDLLPVDLFSTDRLAQAWAVLPDPNRTWRDEVRDGVQPFRAGAETVATLFAEALPPPRRSY
ncbi:hypothetical protein [Alienimonas californiensis]|uniref:Uncharacterized protein n=1 Tax=Alienimonas californiensis TaxID=2527989 RepID=A0A517PDE5_9PLAN|nr:hypothetical protein [Alienimonas californiensis]QDT17390.1 hypothetical protein CA12_35110 [Alienimonas californiensis]